MAGSAKPEPGPRVLIITGETGQFRYYAEVAKRLLREGLEIAFCCDRDDPGVGSTIAATAAEIGVPYYKHAGDREAGALGGWDKLAWHLWRWRNRGSPVPADIAAATIAAMRRYHFFRFRAAIRLLKDYRPDVIVLGEDGIAIDLWAIVAARQLRIKVAVLPYGMADSSSLIWKGVEQKARDGELITTHSPGGQFIADNYPKWVKSTPYGEAMLLPPAYILAWEELGGRLPDPWCFQGGDSDVILIESQIMLERYVKEGIPAGKLRQVGTVYCDVLNDAIRRDAANQAAFASYGMHRNDELRILFCVPPSENAGWQSRSGYPSVAEFVGAIDRLMASLHGVLISYSFHPRTLAADREALVQQGIVEDPRFVVDQIPDCDVLLACSSSVVRWAIAARRLVLNLDIYRFGINDFPHIPSFVYLDSVEELRAKVEELLACPDLLPAATQASAEASVAMGLVDGLAARRIADELRRVCARA